MIFYRIKYASHKKKVILTSTVSVLIIVNLLLWGLFPVFFKRHEPDKKLIVHHHSNIEGSVIINSLSELCNQLDLSQSSIQLTKAHEVSITVIAPIFDLVNFHQGILAMPYPIKISSLYLHPLKSPLLTLQLKLNWL